MSMLSKKTVKQTCGSTLSSMCGSRTEATQKKKNMFKPLAAIIYKNKRNAAGNSEKVVHPGVNYRDAPGYYCLSAT